MAKKSQRITEYEVYEADVVIPFGVKGRDGKVNWFCVGHMSGANRDKYLAKLQGMGTTQIGADGNPQYVISGSTEGLSTVMLEYCIFGFNKPKNDEDMGYSNGELVGREVIETWEDALIDRLTATAMTMNGLAEDSQTVLGNDSKPSNGEHGTESQKD